MSPLPWEREGSDGEGWAGEDAFPGEDDSEDGPSSDFPCEGEDWEDDASAAFPREEIGESYIDANTVTIIWHHSQRRPRQAKTSAAGGRCRASVRKRDTPAPARSRKGSAYRRRHTPSTSGSRKPRTAGCPWGAAWKIADALGCSIDVVVGRYDDDDEATRVRRTYDRLSPGSRELVDEFLDFIEYREHMIASQGRWK